MRILHVIDSLNVGGAEALVTGLSAISKRSGDGVELYVLREGGLLESEVLKAGIPVHNGGSGSVYSILHVLRLQVFLKSRQFDVIHVHLYPAQLWVCLASHLAGCKTPIVTTEHSTTNLRRADWFQWPDRWMYGQFTAIAAISEATRDALLDHIGKKTAKIHVVPNGIDESRFARVFSAPREITAAGLKILTVGSLTRIKDQATIIRALARIEGAALVVAGDGPLRKELELLATNLGVRSRVEFLGVRTDIPELIADSDIYVQASRWEGFCLAVAEAMCGGLPVIVTRNPGLQEVAGQAGLYFNPGNAEELASAMRLLLGDSERRAAMSALGIIQAKKFTLGACWAGYQDFYREAIRESVCVN